jgi:hypothetical protein
LVGALTVVIGLDAAEAADGMVEINQSSAMAGNVTTGDAAGWPVDIWEPGSYLLTGNLTVPDGNTTAIIIRHDNVTLDLNGFVIQGPETAGSGDGVQVTFSVSPLLGLGVTIRNGSIRGMGRDGILAVNGPTFIESVRSMSNGQNGLDICQGTVGCSVRNSAAFKNGDVGIKMSSLGGSIIDSTATTNGGDGIVSFDESLVRGNTAWLNGDDGIHVIHGNTVADNVVNDNDSAGIKVADGNTVRGNTAFENDGAGITVNEGNTIHGNTSRANGSDGIFGNGGSNVYGNTTTNNTGHGISVNGPSRIYGNTSSFNTRAGLRMQANVGFAENVMAGNGEGNIQSGTSMGTNFCETNTTCP